MIIKDSRCKIRPMAHYLDRYSDNEEEKDALVMVMKKFIPHNTPIEEAMRDIAIEKQELEEAIATGLINDDTIKWDYWVKE